MQTFDFKAFQVCSYFLHFINLHTLFFTVQADFPLKKEQADELRKQISHNLRFRRADADTIGDRALVDMGVFLHSAII